MKCEKCGGELEIDFTKILTSLPAKYEAKCKKCGHIKYILCSEVHFGVTSIGSDGTSSYQKSINKICEPIYYYESNKPSIIHNDEIKNSEKIVIVTDELLKQLKDTSDLLSSYKQNADKDHRIAVLERALELACKDLEECADWACECNGDDFVYDNFYYGNDEDGGKDIHDSKYFIDQAEKEMEEIE